MVSIFSSNPTIAKLNYRRTILVRITMLVTGTEAAIRWSAMSVSGARTARLRGGLD